MNNLKSWWSKYVTIARVEMVLCVVFGIIMVLVGNIGAALVWICCFTSWLCCDLAERRWVTWRDMAAREMKEKNDAIVFANKMKQKCNISKVHHYLTFLRMRLAENDAEFCKRKKNCSEYLSYKQCVEEAIAEAEDKVVKMRAAYKEKYGEGSL